MDDASEPVRKLSDVRAENDARLMGIDGVVGVGEGKRRGREFIRVYVARDRHAMTSKLPREIEGYDVVVEESGEFKAL